MVGGGGGIWGGEGVNFNSLSDNICGATCNKNGIKVDLFLTSRKVDSIFTNFCQISCSQNVEILKTKLRA